MNRKHLFYSFLFAGLILSKLCGAFVFADSYKISEADVFIEVPALRQYGDYSCGTTCVQMIMNYLYPYDGDLNLTFYEEELVTDRDTGTSPDNIVRVFHENGVSFSEQRDIPLTDLVSFLDEGKIVMMAIQAWSAADDGSYNLDDPEVEDYLTEGHWVICVGYGKDTAAEEASSEDAVACNNTEYANTVNSSTSDVLFYFNDPACVGHCVMTAEDLDKRWIDMDAAGEIFSHYGLIIDGSACYDADTAYYLQ